MGVQNEGVVASGRKKFVYAGLSGLGCAVFLCLIIFSQVEKNFDDAGKQAAAVAIMGGTAGALLYNVLGIVFGYNLGRIPANTRGFYVLVYLLAPIWGFITGLTFYLLARGEVYLLAGVPTLAFPSVDSELPEQIKYAWAANGFLLGVVWQLTFVRIIGRAQARIEFDKSEKAR